MKPEAAVLDCSAVAAFLLGEEQGAGLETLLFAAAGGEVKLCAPVLLPYEFHNVLLVAERRGRIPAGERIQLQWEFDRLEIELAPPPDAGACAKILQLAAAHALTFYDASYLALARQMNALLWTLDRDLLGLASTYSWIRGA